MLLALCGNDAPFALYIWLGGLKAVYLSLYSCCNPAMCYWHTNVTGESSTCPSQLCYQAAFCLQFRQHRTDVTLALCKQPCLYLFLATSSRSTCVIKNVFCPNDYKKEQKTGLVPGCLRTLLRCHIAGGYKNLYDTNWNRIAFAGVYAHLFTCKDPTKWAHACFQTLPCFGPVMLSPKYPHCRNLSQRTAQLSWKLNQDTDFELLINTPCIPRIRFLVMLKLNSNAILKCIICWIYFTSGLS